MRELWQDFPFLKHSSAEERDNQPLVIEYQNKKRKGEHTMEVIVTKENFKEEVLDAKKPVLVDFWATWCMPCKRQGVILEEMAADGITIGKIDVDEQPELAAQFRVMSIPTLIIFKDGQEAERLVGLRSREELEQILKKY